ncbi:copper/silver-translocating P-type ATPase,heavy metal-translocating P-type ATPase, Cd/Co/Hg/Pb/Zn-transporting [Rhizobium leguminosarum bv. trifolii WSM2297]|uniref:Copper/silver-translocating P-type ATPase,heavy metal-translocating P-type ATPase, Cd/Co/Hg/Pb/Zn-transporting n=1 Tax=Rhizobium leguminosarum bv. trifolii WSM2297 TaxID=754762 RepID=J0W4T2_RHILT|nr:cation-translocating P-type ATPase [Rhizobium leguminosarum]EJC80711.1 copper/silver-translocating P-type ATPase,heavy metal-translocating P-type ATPase, Cd/Co/Hg/Pb/Zn-transporting [Rhizobium leguminosarum bv. trifolii WSM2297]
MTCCSMDTESVLALSATSSSAEEARLASHPLGEGLRQLDLSVPDVHCGGCISTIERALSALPFVSKARVNLTARRVTCVYQEEIEKHPVDPSKILAAINAAGYRAHLFTPAAPENDRLGNQLLLAVGVSGFAAANIMLLSVSVWSGADAATRDMFHWISAMIAAPALVYAGRFFFTSAWNALKRGRTNMDVPISLAVTLSYAVSLWETIHHGEHAWFEASVSLLFFLLIGRTLDHVMREKARAAINGLARLAPRGALLMMPDGSRRYIAVDEIAVGDEISIAAGERVPVDGIVVSGESDIDLSIVTGESGPVAVAPHSEVNSGAMNLTGSLVFRATRIARNSLLSEIIGLMEAAEGGRARYRRIADRAAALYSPAVHLLALLSFLTWGFLGGDWKRAMLVAVAVLIITCPCALGLAVPVVQVVAAGELFRRGIMVKDGSALERLAEADTVAFDKTGTLTMGRPRLVRIEAVDEGAAAIAHGLAAHSRHPLSQALVRDTYLAHWPSFGSVTEIPGGGLEARNGEDVYRLGNAAFACETSAVPGADDSPFSEVVLSKNGAVLAQFFFDDTLRPGAFETIGQLAAAGLETLMMSGDRQTVVDNTARALGIKTALGALTPKQKVDECQRLSDEDHRVLMVGDGINDAPALAAAHVSMAPSTASDIGRQAADLVFFHDRLDAVPEAIALARRSASLIRQNFVLAIGYNVLAVPIAIAGLATPLLAAVAMSTSSIIVVTNALRLNAFGGRRTTLVQAQAGGSREAKTV